MVRNEQIINSWNRIKPDNATHERILNNVLDRIHSKTNKTPYWKRLAPVAACLVMVIIFTTVIGINTGWFGGKTYTVELSGGTLHFYKSDMNAASLALELGVDVTARDLTKEENNLLFGDLFGGLGFSSHGFFAIGDEYAPDKSLLYVEAKSQRNDGGMKIIFAVTNLGYITDAMIDTDSAISEINGVPVSAGYWITPANSRGDRSIIYLTAYETAGISVYVENGGSLERSNEIRDEIAVVVDTLTRNGTPNITDINEFIYANHQIIFLGVFDTDASVLEALNLYFKNRDDVIEQSRSQMLEQNPNIIRVEKYGGLQITEEFSYRDIYVVVGNMERDFSIFNEKMSKGEVTINTYPEVFVNGKKMNVNIIRYK